MTKNSTKSMVPGIYLSEVWYFWRVWHVWPVWRICDRHMCDTGRVTVDAFLEPPRRNVQWPLPPDRRTEITGFSELKKNRRKKKKNQQIWPKFKNQTTNAKKKNQHVWPPPVKKKDPLILSGNSVLANFAHFCFRVGLGKKSGHLVMLAKQINQRSNSNWRIVWLGC